MEDQLHEKCSVAEDCVGVPAVLKTKFDKEVEILKKEKEIKTKEYKELMKMSLKHSMGLKVNQMQRKIKDYEFHYANEGETRVDWKSILKKSSQDMY